ncbi:MAG: hypothetical protein H5T73_03975 [Actinobacteria bacterium]|nr:hypothetical protein [Actinomycetota bacterium]
MRHTEKAAYHAVVVLAALAAFAFMAGCGKQAARERVETGKPAVLNFWQPG